MNAVVPEKFKKELHKLVEVFLLENQKINLSALRTPETCWIGNVLDSLSLLQLSQLYYIPNTSYHILDLGTGGGFPLLPLAICLPQAHCAGLDSTKKKIDAIDRIVRAMDMKNVSLLTERAEVLAHDPQHREQYDIITARAVGELAELLELMAPFTKVNGYCIAWKSLHIDEELIASQTAQETLHCKLIAKHEYELPGDFGRRQLLIFQKMKTTPPQYPRAVGIPKKQPLK